MRRWTWIYLVGTICVLGVGIVQAGVVAAARHHVLVIVSFAVIAFLSEFGRVRLSENVSISGSALVAELAVLALPPAAAALTVAIGSAVGQRASRILWWKSIFNGALLGLCTLVGSLVFALVGGHPGMPVTSGLLGPYAILLLSWNATNVIVLGGMLGTINGQNPLRYCLSIERSIGYNQLVFAVVGLFMDAVYFQMHLLGILFIFLMLLAVRAGFQLYANSRNFYQDLVGVLGRALTFKDPGTGDHSERVADLAAAIGRQMGFVDRELDLLRHAALMHDVGKVAIPDMILGKPGPLDPDERVTMDLHVTAGDSILEQSRYLEGVAGMVRGHHERLDGRGYPERLIGGDIPLAARIIAVADAYDAMTQDRPYRRALPEGEAALRLVEGSGSQFDPHVVRALFRLKGIDASIEARATAVAPALDAAAATAPPLAAVGDLGGPRSLAAGPAPRPRAGRRGGVDRSGSSGHGRLPNGGIGAGDC